MIPDGAFVLSTAQEGLWAAELLNPESSAQVTGQYSDILGALDVATFERASQQVIEETEALRLCFGGPADQPLQWVAPLDQWSLSVIDLSGEPEPHTAALAWMKTQHARPLDVGSGRAFRWTLLRLGAARFVWSFQVHHLLMDGFSRNAVWRRLDQVYSALAAGVAVPQGEVGSLRDLFAEVHDYGRSESFDEDRRYFAALLQDRPGRVTLSGRPAAASREFRRATVHLPRDLTEDLRARVAGASLAQAVTAAAALLQRSEAGGDDLVMGFAVGARRGALARRTPSMLSNVVPLRLRLSGDISIDELMSRAGRAIREVMPHQRYASQALRKDLKLSPLAPDAWGLTVNFMPFDQGASFGGYVANTHNLSNGPVADLTVGVFDSPGQNKVRIDLNGNRELYEDAELAKHLDRLVALLAALAHEPTTRPIGALFAKAEATAVNPPRFEPRLDEPAEVSLLGPRFDAIAVERGDSVALVDGSRRFTYRELLRRAGALTTALQVRGIGPGDQVGVAMPRSAEMVVAVVGIARSGAAYVPVDLLDPPERRALILADARPRLIVGDGTAPGVPADFEYLQLPDAGESDPTPAVIPSENDGAYIIYTSGSTGRPNGVRVTQRNVARLFTVLQPLYDFTPSDVWSLFHSLAFDFSVFELWGALLTGGRLVVVPADTAKASDAFHALVLREGVTILSQTPSAFRAFDAADSAAARPANRLRQVIFGGEKLDPRTLRDWFNAHGDQQPRLVNMYGITETTVHATYRPIGAQDARGHGQSPIGVPLPDLHIELLDPEGVEVADGQVGEICVSGAGVTSGYVERPELTARRFQPDPRRGAGALRYRSGDLARRLPDGGLEYLGRADQQVKLRGFRVELGEIEAALRESPSVRDAVVALREDSDVGPILVAYVVVDGTEPLEPDSMRRDLVRRLPEYMVPAAFVRIERVPRTVNDKVDRKGLTAPSMRDFPSASSGEAPRDELERTVADIFCTVLARPVALRESDFFRLGGHSLLAVRATLLCRERLQIELPIRALFEHPTVAGLAAAMREMAALGHRQRQIAQIARGSPMPLSPQQRALWLEVQLRVDDGAYNVPMAFSAAGPLDATRLRTALVHLALAHEVLHGRIVEASGEPCLIFDRDPAALELDWADAKEPEADFARALRRPFDLLRGPLWRCVVRPLPDGRTLFALVVHHLVIDAAGGELLLRDLAEAHARPDRALIKRPHDFADLAAYENERLRADRASLERFWVGELAGAEAPELPAPLSPCPPGGELGSVRARRALPQALAVCVRELAAELGTTPFHVYFAAYLALLRIYTSRDDLVVGSLVSLRDTPAAENVVGYLLAPVVLRMQMCPASSFRETVSDLVRRWKEIRSHARLPMDLLVHATRMTTRLEFGSPFQLFFSLLEKPSLALRLGDQNLTPLDTVPASAKFKLFLQVEHRGPTATLALEFQRGVLDRETGARLLVHLEEFLQAATAQPDTKLSELEWIPDADGTQLADWNSTAEEYPRGQPLTQLLQAQAARTPVTIALEAGDCRLTYAELFERAGVLAARLKQAGVSREARVGLYLDRHPTLPEAMLAILDAGGAYVPLDPTFPRERLAFMVEDAGVCAIVTRRALLPELPPHSAQVICVDDDSPVGPPAAGWLPADASSLAYVLYTSGSTGKPKGVAVEHRQLVNFLSSMSHRPGIVPSDALLAVTSISFDIAGLEIWLPLFCGARICLANREEARDAELLKQALARSRATVLQATPSVWRALLASGWSGGAHFKALVGGEALPSDLAELLAASCGEAWNMYGPTETTIWSSAWRLPRPAGRPRVGKPIANTELHVLDEGLRPLPIGVPGELFIGGEGVARGYLNRPELTAHSFVGDPFRGGAARMYRTGDLARWLPDGNLDLLGRNDDQFKVRGHRIEAGDVEAALLRLPGVAQAAVALHRPENGDPRLVAYLVPQPDVTMPPSANLRAELRHRLAEYMLPYHFVQIAALPLTPNGKVDRRSLAQLRPQPGRAASAGVALSAAASVVEADLVARFGSALGRTVTLDSDFFEAGGDSLGALRLISRLSQERGLDLTTGELFLHSTPRRMAARLEQLLAGAARPRHLLPLRSSRGCDSIFLVHPVGGHLAPYARLAHHLDASVTLFGLQAAGKLPYPSIEQRCAAYVEEVMAASSGSLILVGYSLGGALAVEMAEQLRRAGRVVSLVLLLDAAVPRPFKRGWAKLRHRTSELRRFSWRDRRIWLTEQFSRRIFPMGDDAQDYGEAEGLIDSEEMKLLFEQALRWQSPQYAGKVRLFRADRNLRGYPNPAGALGWDRYCSDLEVLDLPCNHAEILVEPQVLRIVAEMESLLDAGSHPRPDYR